MKRAAKMAFGLGGLQLSLLLTVVLLVIIAFRQPSFFTATGIAGGIVVAAPLILASIAITPIALVGRGGVDLSIGPLVGFINITIVTLLAGLGISDPVSIFVYAIAAGCLWQAGMAAIIVTLRVSPIIVSLSGFLILQGVNLIILPRPGGSAPQWLANWGWGTEIVSPVLWLLVAAGLLWAAFRASPMFQAIRITGADERMAYTCGVNVVAARFAAHLVAGVFAGLAAVSLTGLIGSGDPIQGNSLTLKAVTALVLGGTALTGGRGGALGSAVGAVAMYLIFVVLSSLNFGSLSGFMTQAAFGLILVLTLITAVVSSRKPA